MKRRCFRKCSMKGIRALCIVLAPIYIYIYQYMERRLSSTFNDLHFNKMQLDRINFGYSMKNIPITSKQQYLKQLISLVEHFQRPALQQNAIGQDKFWIFNEKHTYTV